MWMTVIMHVLRNRRARRWIALLLAVLAVLFVTIPGAILAATAPTPPPIPTSCSTPNTGPAQAASVKSAGGLNSTQLHNAGLIIGIGRQTGVSSRGWTIALMAAMQESTLQNLDHGDVVNGSPTTSKGLFQMLAGTAAAAGISNTDPVADIHWFYKTLSNVPNWQSMTLDSAAQSVELSGNPDAYAKWQPLAEQLVRTSAAGKGAATQAATPLPCRDSQIPVSATGKARVAITAALSELGKPYCWGGGGTSGPSEGIPTNGPVPGPNGLSPGCSPATPGFDCSGLMQYAWGKAGVALPRTTALQVTAGTPVTSQAQLRPGDLVLPDPGHVVMWLGDNQIVEAPHDGVPVRKTAFYGMWRAVRVSG